MRRVGRKATDALAEIIRGERLRFVFIQSPLPVALSPVVGLILAWALWGVIDQQLLMVWAGGLVAAAPIRLWLIRSYPKAPTPRSVRTWERTFVTSATLVALWWGIGGLFLLSQSSAERLLVFCFLMLVAAGAAASYAAHPFTVVLTVLGIALPITIAFALEDDAFQRALAAGATIYLLAAFGSIKTLSYFFARTHRLAHELELERDRAQRLARTDELTGLKNRRAFYEEARAALKHAKRYNHKLTVLMLDIDHFKAVNDEYGHAAGDEVLRQVARLIAEHHRSTDIVGRVGGEEFAMLLPETDLTEAFATAERLRATLGAQTLEVNGATIQYTTSLGVAELDSDQTLDQLMIRADAALYSAKRAGRNRVMSSSRPGSSPSAS